MVEVMLGPKRLDAPYTIRIPGISESQFDRLTDEDTKAELLDGVMIVHSPATLRHDGTSHFLRSLMSLYAEERAGGLVFGPDSIVRIARRRKFAPDIFYLRTGRVPRRWPKQYKGVPNLAAEVLSPSTRRYDLEEKRPAYRKAGVEEIWFVDPKHRRVLIDRLVNQCYVEETISEGRAVSHVLEGFWVELEWLWSEPPPSVLSCLRQILGGNGRRGL